jgi:prepilin-type N-terminal cleavage/methylation domain-containing protein
MQKKGFTLMEVLLVIGIIAILAAIVIVAINPARQLGSANNADRRSDINTILNAVYQFAIDNQGTIITEITTTVQEICAGGVASSTCSSGSLADLDNLIHNEKYLTAIPTDPQGATTTNGTGYSIVKSSNGRITVKAMGAQLGDIISVTR